MKNKIVKILMMAIVPLLVALFVGWREIDVYKKCINKESYLDSRGSINRFVVWQNDESGEITNEKVCTETYYEVQVGRTYKFKDEEFYIIKY